MRDFKPKEQSLGQPVKKRSFPVAMISVLLVVVFIIVLIATSLHQQDIPKQATEPTNDPQKRIVIPLELPLTFLSNDAPQQLAIQLPDESLSVNDDSHAKVMLLSWDTSQTKEQPTPIYENLINEPFTDQRQQVGKTQLNVAQSAANKQPTANQQPTSQQSTAKQSATNQRVTANESLPVKSTKTISHQIRSGENLFVIFKQYGISTQYIHDLLAIRRHAKVLSHIQLGKTIVLTTSKNNELIELQYPIDKLQTLHISEVKDAFVVAVIKQDITRKIQQVSGEIKYSLFSAANKAGISDQLTMKLANIFGWDIDFALDIRTGDRFSVIFESLYVDGKKIGDGEILAAEFMNMGKLFQAVRYVDKLGHASYYTPQGTSLRKAFLRTPVEFSRISSRFYLKRWHPLLHRVKAHRGVDYAAAHGTPIKATGDGIIRHRARKGGYGKTIIIQHGNKYSTVYAHMSRYKKGFRTGSHIRQGQIIGYIGSTGLATGPHLHYEFRVNGVYRNPLTVTLPQAKSITKSQIATFRKTIEPLVSQLENNRPIIVALQK